MKPVIWAEPEEMISIARACLVLTASVRDHPPTQVEAVSVLACIALREAFGVRPPQGELILGAGYSEIAVRDYSLWLTLPKLLLPERLDPDESFLFYTTFGSPNYLLGPDDLAETLAAPLLVAYDSRQFRSRLRWRGDDGDRCLAALPFALEPDNPVTAAYTLAQRR